MAKKVKAATSKIKESKTETPIEETSNEVVEAVEKVEKDLTRKDKSKETNYPKGTKFWARPANWNGVLHYGIATKETRDKWSKEYKGNGDADDWFVSKEPRFTRIFAHRAKLESKN